MGIGSFFSKAFKTVKNVAKKVTSPITKIIRKTSKAIANVGKNMWNGIKEVGGKALQAYMKFSERIGPVGQIGMAIAMPYLMSGFTGMAGGLWTNFGAKTATWAGQANNPFLNVLGKVGTGIYKGANFTKGTFKGISDTIGATFKGFAGSKDAVTGVRSGGSISQGFKNFFQGTGEVLSGKAGMGTIQYGQVGSAAQSKKIFDAMGQTIDVDTRVLARIKNTGGYITQTGGVGLGNANVANKFAFESINNTMAKSGLLEGLSKDSMKYMNSLEQFGIDKRSAYEYVRLNGVGMDGTLDFAKSADFSFVAPTGGYEYTGKNFANTMKQFDVTAATQAYAPKVKGDVFKTKDVLLGKSNTSLFQRGKDAAMALFTSGNDAESQAYNVQLGSLNDSNLTSSSMYQGTNIAGDFSGSLLNKTLQEEFLKQQQTGAFNIAGSR